MLRITILLLAVLSLTNLWAQENETTLQEIRYTQGFNPYSADEPIEPEPFQDLYYSEDRTFKNVKSRTYIRKSKVTDFNADTIRKDFFNELEQKTKSIRYEDNEPEYTVQLFYTKENKLSYVKGIHKNYISYNFYYRNKKGLVDSITSTRTTYFFEEPDSSITMTKKFVYDNSRIIRYEQESPNRLSTVTYEYENGQLRKKLNEGISKRFYYNSENKLSELREYAGTSFAQDKLIKLKFFNYDSFGRLKSDSTVSGIETNQMKNSSAHYDYYEDGMLKSMNCKVGNQYRKVQFHYESNLIESVVVETNTAKNAYLEFFISHHIKNYYRFPIQYKEDFNYDEYGNLRSKKSFVNDELFSETEFILEYR